MGGNLFGNPYWRCSYGQLEDGGVSTLLLLLTFLVALVYLICQESDERRFWPQEIEPHTITFKVFGTHFSKKPTSYSCLCSSAMYLENCLVLYLYLVFHNCCSSLCTCLLGHINYIT